MHPPYSQKQVTCSTRCTENHAAFRSVRIPAAVLMDDAMLALQSARIAAPHRDLDNCARHLRGHEPPSAARRASKGGKRLRALTGQLIAVSDDAAVPENERFSSDLASRRALYTASLNAAEAFAVSHDAVLPALLNALSTVKQLSPDRRSHPCLRR